MKLRGWTVCFVPPTMSTRPTSRWRKCGNFMKYASVIYILNENSEYWINLFEICCVVYKCDKERAQRVIPLTANHNYYSCFNPSLYITGCSVIGNEMFEFKFKLFKHHVMILVWSEIWVIFTVLFAWLSQLLATKCKFKHQVVCRGSETQLKWDNLSGIVLNCHK